MAGLNYTKKVNNNGRAELYQKKVNYIQNNIIVMKW